MPFWQAFFFLWHSNSKMGNVECSFFLLISDLRLLNNVFFLTKTLCNHILLVLLSFSKKSWYTNFENWLFSSCLEHAKTTTIFRVLLCFFLFSLRKSELFLLDLWTSISFTFCVQKDYSKTVTLTSMFVRPNVSKKVEKTVFLHRNTPKQNRQARTSWKI